MFPFSLPSFHLHISRVVPSSPVGPEFVPESVSQVQVDSSAILRVGVDPEPEHPDPIQANLKPQEQPSPSTPQDNSAHQEATHIPSLLPSVHTASDSLESDRDEVTGPSYTAVSPLCKIQSLINLFANKHLLQPHSSLRIEAAPARESIQSSHDDT